MPRSHGEPYAAPGGMHADRAHRRRASERQPPLGTPHSLLCDHSFQRRGR